MTVRRPGGAAYIEVLCKGPSAGSPDVYPLLVAAGCVLAFAPACARDGGSGATYVLLRRNPSR